ncbi:MAG: DeoR/GlpR family DNA-binding transcription regulator [Spirochaetaceae bacterium]|jgi:DeoR family fructose operon transcriptional repressor|nr:DeoR/GlpR family DNA-binding transcription regulator [Spirochaetaceae bacterium]
MNGAERKQAILQLLQEKESIHVDELTERFGVSKVTIRGDLDILQQKGLLVRTHGGAMLPEKRDFIRIISHTMHESTKEKDEIARLAASLVSSGQAIIIDSGSTTMHMAKYLVDKQVTVATNSLLVMQQLMNEETVDLVLIGGSLRRFSMSAIGSIARSCLTQIHADWLFLGGSGYSVEKGITCSNLVEADTKQAMIQNAERVCFVADSSKMGKVSFASVTDWSHIDVLVTDRIDTETRIILEGYGVKVMVPKHA